MGLAGRADVTPVGDEPMVGLGDKLFGDVADKLFFGGQRRATVRGQANAIGHAEDVRIDG